MTNPQNPTVPNTFNSPGGLNNIGTLNNNGVGNPNQTSQSTNLYNTAGSSNTINLDPFNQPPTMKTLIYSPEIMVKIATSTGKEYDVSADVVRGQLYRVENSASTFFCELANKKGQYTKDGGLFSCMDRITVYMKRVNWVQVFSGYLDQVPWAQMWAGNVTIKATCTLKRLLYTYWNPNLPGSQFIFNQFNILSTLHADTQGFTADAGLGDMLGNLVCWVGGWNPENVHIQDFPVTFLEAMLPEFYKMANNNNISADAFLTQFLGSDHTLGVGSAAGQAYLSTGPGLGPQVVGALEYKQQVLQAVDDRGMGPTISDIQNSYTLEQASATGQNTKDNAVREAFNQNSALGQNLQTQARSADAAILAFACVYAESNWTMYANKSVPESLSYHYDALEPPWEGTSMGLFQQISSGWGTTQQRMNAYASAGMFLDALAKLTGWENMEPAKAIAAVQRNRDGWVTYAPFIEVARNEVQGLRAAQGKYTPQNIGGVGLTTLTGSTSAQAIVGAGVGGAGIPGVSQNSPAPSAPPVAVPGRPQPDAQGAVMAAYSVLGRPYKAGESGPAAFDSAGLIAYCYRTVGREIGTSTGAQAGGARERVPDLASVKPGDVLQIDGGLHTAMMMDNGQVIQIMDGGVVSLAPLFEPQRVTAIYRYADWGGPGPAPFNPVAGPGTAVGTGWSGGATSTGSQGQTEQIARNLFSFMFYPMQFASPIATLYTGEKSFIDSQPLVQEVNAVSRAGLRNFASAPNGDFIAYYPDYFGVDGKPIAMTIEDIEMKDTRINLSDDALTTHVYVTGDATGMGQIQQPLGWLLSGGVATVENETLFQRLKQVVPGGLEGLSGQLLLQKYGVRPIQLEFNMAAKSILEFLLACQVFMQKWAEQYETTASFTFMPELFPGMRVALGNTGIAVYIAAVTHTFDYEQGFSTTAQIMAPSAVNGGKTVDTVVPKPADATTVTRAANIPGGT